jgi:alpha-galactosidase
VPKVAFIGAGSTVFAKNLIVDLLSYPELRDSTELVLMDIDERRLETSEIVARRVADKLNARPQITATLDRREAVDGAGYVLTMFQVGGYRPATVVDFEVPKEFGLRQTIADTLGVGGIMRGLRTIPVLLDLCRDMEELCPDAWLLQYVNPMAILCWAAARATSIKTVGLCHSVQGTVRDLAGDLGLPPHELDFDCAGINHLAFYLRLEHDGHDLYPRLRQVRPPDTNRVRYELLKHFGYFVTESSEHVAEYTPWFIRASRPELVERFNIPLDEYIARCETQIAEWEELRRRLLDGDGDIETRRSDEYGAPIVHALETGAEFAFYGNVPNTFEGEPLISNLAPDACVEVRCTAGRDGIRPHAVGALPPQLVGLIESNVNVQRLVVEAALTGNREHVYHAAALDPHTAAELPLDEIHALVDRLLEAHASSEATYHSSSGSKLS